MARPGRTAVVVVIVCAVVLAAAFALHRYNTSPRMKSRRAEEARHARERERFTAKFDSLKQARLYPAAYRTAPFTRTSLDDDQQEWTLTRSSADWKRRDRASKMDLVARLHTTFQAARAQAGGDPEIARLVIQDDDGEMLAECSPETGAVIHR